jgi:hypothetical protein
MRANASTAVIRQWARQQGLAVGDRGRLAPAVLEAYESQAPPTAPEPRRVRVASARDTALTTGGYRIVPSPVPTAWVDEYELASRSSPSPPGSAGPKVDVRIPREVRLTGSVQRSWPFGFGDLAGVAMTERLAGGPRLVPRSRGLAVRAWLDGCRAAVGCGPGVRVQVLPAGGLPDVGDLLWSGGRPPLRPLGHGQVCARCGPLGVKTGPATRWRPARWRPARR